MAGIAQNFPSKRHCVCQQQNMSFIHRNPVTFHHRNNLINDTLASSFNSQHFCHLHNMIAFALQPLNAISGHHLFQPVSF